jgi:hypothetical protein
MTQTSPAQTSTLALPSVLTATTLVRTGGLLGEMIVVLATTRLLPENSLRIPRMTDHLSSSPIHVPKGRDFFEFTRA